MAKCNIKYVTLRRKGGTETYKAFIWKPEVTHPLIPQHKLTGKCKLCGYDFSEHGMINNSSRGIVVHPYDWVIENYLEEFIAMKPILINDCFDVQ